MTYKTENVRKFNLLPINVLFRCLVNKSRIQVWLRDNVNLRIEGTLLGFDEHFNLVLDDAERVEKHKARKMLGRTFVKGESLILVRSIDGASVA
ncbi:small nuclear ribonucleoprotein E [Caerostris darwini]|uniref:Small nuclear ribonucleoprotein E n=1 Tax=Caerostris darwini TaxID=1538125 RepID=A0AAV4TMD7_9ARAC|nr:small nuclear ribonucleoprotein E [Caerostris darwini]